MASPRPPPVALPEVGQASEAATPGASVAAQHGDQYASALDTPGAPSPGQGSPAHHRSQAGDGQLAELGRSGSRGRTSIGLEATAAALANSPQAAAGTPVAAGAPADSPEPLSKPRLRVQGTDIILEDAASPPAEEAAVAVAAAGAAASSKQARAAVAVAGNGQVQQPPVQVAAAAKHGGMQQLEAVPAMPPSPQQQLGAPIPQHHLVAAARVLQSHEHELQLRLASRHATGNSTLAVAGSKALAGTVTATGQGDDRVRGHDGAAGGDAGPSSSSAAVEGPVRMKYRSTLTEENVAYLNKLDQYSSRPDATGVRNMELSHSRVPTGALLTPSADRIWQWLEASGPPFDNPPPSLGVPTISKSSVAAASRRQAGTKRGFFSCFNCFGGQ